MSVSDRLGCPVCDSARVRREPYHYEWKSRRWDVLRCRECTHSFVYPFLTRSDQEDIYDTSYFSAEGDWVCGLWDTGYIGAENQLREEAREVLAMLDRLGGRLLEIGCAGGYFLDEASKIGFDVIGIEPNASMAAYANEKLGLNVRSSWIEDVADDLFSREFDVLVAMDVLEHVPQPGRLFKKLDRWLAPDATVVIRGPLHNDPVAHAKESLRRLLRIEKQLPDYPLDVNWFTKRSLRRLLSIIGVRAPRFIGESRGFANVVGVRGAAAPA